MGRTDGAPPLIVRFVCPSCEKQAVIDVTARGTAVKHETCNSWMTPISVVVEAAPYPKGMPPSAWRKTS